MKSKMVKKQYALTLSAVGIIVGLLVAFQNCSGHLTSMDQLSGGNDQNVKDLCKVTAVLPEFQIKSGAQTFDSKGAGAVKIVNRTAKAYTLTSVLMSPKTSTTGTGGILRLQERIQHLRRSRRRWCIAPRPEFPRYR